MSSRLMFCYNGQHLVRIGQEQARATGVDQALHFPRLMQRRGEQLLDAIIRQAALRDESRMMLCDPRLHVLSELLRLSQ